MSTHAPLQCCRRNRAKGKEQLLFETASGQRISLDESTASISIEDPNGNIVRLDSAGITIQTGSKITVNASQVEIAASIVTVNAGMTKFTGVIQADTVIANSIVANSYTPGTGNIW